MHWPLLSQFAPFHGVFLLFITIFVILSTLCIIGAAVFVLVRISRLTKTTIENFETPLLSSAEIALKNLNVQSEQQRQHILSLLMFDPKQMSSSEKDADTPYFVGNFTS